MDILFFFSEVPHSEPKEEKVIKSSGKSHRRLANIRDFLDSSDNEDMSSSSSKKPDHHHQKERKKVLSDSKPSFDSETKSPVAEKLHKERHSDGEKVFVEKSHIREKEPSLDPVERVKLKKKKHDDDRRHNDSFEGSSEKKKKKKHKKEKHCDLDRSLDESFKQKEFKEKTKHEFKDRDKPTKLHKVDDTKRDTKEKEGKKDKDDKKLNITTASPIKILNKEKHKTDHSKPASSKPKTFIYRNVLHAACYTKSLEYFSQTHSIYI